MKNKYSALNLLQETLKNLNEANKWLQRSFLKCQSIGIKQQYTPDEFDAFENLTSRFARTCDFLINKVYRAIDKVELEDSGTLIDTMNRAHKRGLINSVDEIRSIKELRNTISHEYANAKLTAIFTAVFECTALLSALVEKAQIFCKEKYISD